MSLPPCDHDECGPLACRKDGGSLECVDGRAGRSEDVKEERRWWVEWYLHRDSRWMIEGFYEWEGEAKRNAESMFWRGFTVRVVEVVVVERRTIVAEMPARSPIGKLRDDDEQVERGTEL